MLGWRPVPVDADGIGPTALSVMPAFEQLFVAAQPGRAAERHRPGPARPSRCARSPSGWPREAGDELYFPSLSARTLVYKGMLTTAQLATFYPDLSDERFATAIALVHSRFSTNTFPSWPLAQPFRMIAHNGEINTVGGNRNWMRSPAVAAGLATLLSGRRPTTSPGCSRSARPARRTRPPSTRCWSCCTWAGAACRTRC